MIFIHTGHRSTILGKVKDPRVPVYFIAPLPKLAFDNFKSTTTR